PSLNSLTPEQLSVIRQHDAFGVSLSFLKEEIHPTYQVMSWEHDDALLLELMERNLVKHQKRLQDTVFFHHDKDFLRFMHPRILPGRFPQSPTVFFYRLPVSIYLAEGNDFSDGDFDQTLFYR